MADIKSTSLDPTTVGAEPRDLSRVTDSQDSSREDAQIDLSVVMPCLNESQTIAICIRKALSTINSSGLRGEVIVADNGSTDGSQTLALAAGARVVPVYQRGYGSALCGGIAAARGKYVLMGDADDSYDFTQIADFVSKLDEGYDLVMGNRFQGGIRPGAMSPLHRFLGNPVLSWLGRLFFKSPIGDFHCGLRAFRKEAVDNLHLRFLLLYSPRWLFLYPGIALLLLGIAIGAWLLPGPRSVGGVTFDIHTLLFGAMAILIGFQSVYFATFSKVFAITEGLLPEDPRLTRLFRYVTLEVGLAIGILLTFAGACTWLFGLQYWSSRDFGALNPQKTLRIVIPGLVFLTVGIQIILSSFLLSLLGMRHAGTTRP